MSLERRTPSPIRPVKPIDQTILLENRKLIERIDRRRFLRASFSLGTLTMLTGCDVTNRGIVQATLRAMSSWNDCVQAFLFSTNRLAPEFPASQVMKPPRFNAYYGIQDVRPVDGDTWQLELAGLIADKRPLRRGDLYAMPHETQITRLICIEGWDYIGRWSGVPVRYLLERIGADTSAKYVVFRCADDYYSSIDMASALHPQTILATRYDDRILDNPYGFPLRLYSPLKLGIKLPKWIVTMEITNGIPGDYWGDRGYNWFSGL